MNELAEVSNDALLALVERILARDEAATLEAIDSMAVTTRRAYNVAERLLTGRRAEQYFLDNAEAIIHIPRALLLDMRDAARGFDFGVKNDAQTAIEVKGLKGLRGEIVFTDREWIEARCREVNYAVVIVGNLQAKPISQVIRNPHSALDARSLYRTAISVTWSCVVRLGA